MKITGKIEKILDKQTGTSAKGEWVKQSFLVRTDAEYNNLLCFDLWGGEKVDNFHKYSKVGSTVDVEFDIACREHQGKYYTSLSAWKVFTKKQEIVEQAKAAEIIIDDEDNDLPF